MAQTCHPARTRKFTGLSPVAASRTPITGTAPAGASKNTLDPYEFPDGKTAYVNITMMHMAAKSPVPVGTVLNVGDFVGMTGNTGFSTGPHTHVMGRWMDRNGAFIDKNDADNSFDLMAHWNGFYAVDGNLVIGTMKALVGVLQQMVTALTSKAPIKS